MVMTVGVRVRDIDRRRLLGTAGGLIVAGAGQSLFRLQAQEATPATPSSADVEVGPDRLASLLRLLPADLSGDILFTWADLATQLDAAGLPPLDSADDLDGAFIQATQSLPLGDVLRYAALPEYEDTFGFAPVRVDQTLTAGDPGNGLTLLQGRFSERALLRAWERSGYAPVETDDGTVWSFADGAEFDASSPVGRLGVGALNNAAILPDDTVVFAPTVELVATTLTVAAGKAPSLAEREDVATLLDTVPATLVSAIQLRGEALTFEDDVMTPEARQQIEELRAEQEDAVGPMPPVDAALFGITAGLHYPDDSADQPIPATEEVLEPTVVVRLLTDSAEDAGQAAEVVAYRWAEWPSMATGQPLATLLDLESAEAHEREPVTILNFVPAAEATAGVWYQMIYRGDLAAFGP
jgi:hypothetical protein